MEQGVRVRAVVDVQKAMGRHRMSETKSMSRNAVQQPTGTGVHAWWSFKKLIGGTTSHINQTKLDWSRLGLPKVY